MKKAVVLFFITCLLVIADLAYAVDLEWWYIQNRKYENGKESFQIAFAFKNDSGDVITDNIVQYPAGRVELYNPDGNRIEVSDVIFFGPYKPINGNYDAQTDQWDYDGEKANISFYSAYFLEDLKGGDYRLVVTDIDNNTYEKYKFYSGQKISLPLISSDSFSVTKDDTGNLIWTWQPLETTDFGIGMSLQGLISSYKIFDSKEMLTQEVYVTLPSHMDHIFIPKNIVESLEAEGDIYRFRIGVNTNDNEKRTYSNTFLW